MPMEASKQEMSVGNSVQLSPPQLVAKALYAALSKIDENRVAEFKLRFSKHAPRLLECLHSVYGNCADFGVWFEKLSIAMACSVASRKEDLYQLDLARANNSHWFMSQKMAAYSAYVDRFADTLDGVEQRIPYLKNLGITYLHLLPFLRARNGENDGGFAVSSFTEVEPRLGTMAELENLTAALRRNGISLCADFVLNHVADDHNWATAAKNGNNYYRNYFHILTQDAEVENYSKTLGQVFPETAPGNFTKNAELDAWVWTTFYPYQWDLNYANPEVFSEIAGALTNLANRGVEIFRLDSAAFLWKRQGTNCMNQPECHFLLQALRAMMDIVAPGVLLKAEAIVPVHQLPPYFGTGNARGHECHLAYNSSLMTASWLALAEQDVDMIKRVIARTPSVPDGCSWLNYVRCHDDIGWNVLRPELALEKDGGEARLVHAADFFAGHIPESYAAGAHFQSHTGNRVHGTNGMAASLVGLMSAQSSTSIALAKSRLILLYGLSMSIGGTPLIYMGDEFGLGNDDSLSASWPSGADGRQLHRPHFPHDLDEVDVASSLDERLLLKQMLVIRASLPELAANMSCTLLDTHSKSVLMYLRADALYVVGSFSESAQVLGDCVPLLWDTVAKYVDCLTGTIIEKNYKLQPWQMLWLRAKSV